MVTAAEAEHRLGPAAQESWFATVTVRVPVYPPPHSLPPGPTVTITIPPLTVIAGIGGGGQGGWMHDCEYDDQTPVAVTVPADGVPPPYGNCPRHPGALAGS